MSWESFSQNPFSRRVQPVSKDQAELARTLLGEGGRKLAQRFIRTKPQSVLERGEMHIPLTGFEREQLIERALKPGEFYLEEVRKLRGMPGLEILKERYHFDQVSSSHFHSAVSGDQLVWTEEALDRACIDDFRVREMLLAPSLAGEKKRIARVMLMSELFPDGLAWNEGAIEEVLAAIHAAGYRPANYEELLAFSQHIWMFDTRDHGSTHLDAQSLIGFGSVYRLPNGYYDCPIIFRSFGQRCLSSHLLVDRLQSGNALLLMRR